MTTQIKSAVTKRKGRGFSSADDQARGLPSIVSFDTLPATGSSAGRAQRSVEGWVLLVSGLHEEATEDDLHDKFADYGTIVDLKMNLDHRTGYVKGYALVEYASYKEAAAAIEALSGSTLLEAAIKCDFAFVRMPEVLQEEGAEREVRDPRPRSTERCERPSARRRADDEDRDRRVRYGDGSAAD